MNVLTYATPVSVQPSRMWCIGLYKGTLSHENFVRERRGVLQMLRRSSGRDVSTYAREDGEGGDDGTKEEKWWGDVDDDGSATTTMGGLIRALGGSSGRDVDKGRMCAELGYDWERLPAGCDDDDDNWPDVLPYCLYYLKLELVGDVMNCGSHDLALCRVLGMISYEEEVIAGDELDILSTRELRERSIISELGRVLYPPPRS